MNTNEFINLAKTSLEHAGIYNKNWLLVFIGIVLLIIIITIVLRRKEK